MGTSAVLLFLTFEAYILPFVDIALFRGLGPGPGELLSSLHGGSSKSSTKYPQKMTKGQLHNIRPPSNSYVLLLGPYVGGWNH